MAQIDFYVLPENSKREYFVCALIQKAWKQGNSIFIKTSSESAATALDHLLWTFKDISFLPHSLVTGDSADTATVIIGYASQIDDHVPDHATVMVNLADRIPEKLNKVERVLEIVSGNEEERRQSRRRYVDYRNQGHVLNKHTIESGYG